MNNSVHNLIAALKICFYIITATLVSYNAQANFHNKALTASVEIWGGAIPIFPGGSLLFTSNSALITASNDMNPDLEGFRIIPEREYEYWDIDFSGNTISMEFTSIDQRTFDHQYMYTSPRGFHFEDTENQLPEIVGISINYAFAPFAFNPDLSGFDADNIWISLEGSMCHTTAMGSMPTCTNPASPTGYDNSIIVTVEFAGEISINDRADALFDWAEDAYADYFQSKETSFEIAGYYARYYPLIDTYLGTDGTDLYLYDQVNGLTNLGNLEGWLNQQGF